MRTWPLSVTGPSTGALGTSAVWREYGIAAVRVVRKHGYFTRRGHFTRPGRNSRHGPVGRGDGSSGDADMEVPAWLATLSVAAGRPNQDLYGSWQCRATHALHVVSRLCRGNSAGWLSPTVVDGARMITLSGGQADRAVRLLRRASTIGLALMELVHRQAA